MCVCGEGQGGLLSCVELPCSSTQLILSKKGDWQQMYPNVNYKCADILWQSKAQWGNLASQGGGGKFVPSSGSS